MAVTSLYPSLQDVDVCIIGAGPVGGSLACRLAVEGLRVAIVDHADLPPMAHPDFDGRAYAIAAGPRQLLEDAGIWKALPLSSCPIENILVTDGRPGSLLLHCFWNSPERTPISLLAGWWRPVPCAWH